ncbi:MAG: hypothetical protein ACRDQA_05190 [Nocardioidaceae bacterium]
MGPTATEKQQNYIISLYNQGHGTTHGYLSQCDQLPLSQRQKRGGMTKVEASAIIDQLKVDQ